MTRDVWLLLHNQPLIHIGVCVWGGVNTPQLILLQRSWCQSDQAGPITCRCMMLLVLCTTAYIRGDDNGMNKRLNHYPYGGGTPFIQHNNTPIYIYASVYLLTIKMSWTTYKVQWSDVHLAVLLQEPNKTKPSQSVICTTRAKHASTTTAVTYSYITVCCIWDCSSVLSMYLAGFVPGTNLKNVTNCHTSPNLMAPHLSEEMWNVWYSGTMSRTKEQQR